MKSERIHAIFNRIVIETNKKEYIRASIIPPPPDYDSGDEHYFTPLTAPVDEYTIGVRLSSDGKDMVVPIPVVEPYITVGQIKMLVMTHLNPRVYYTIKILHRGVILADHIRFAPNSKSITNKLGLILIQKGHVIQAMCLKR
ncbi:hypothetical protein BY458DRAFT_162692 [Sporodiniella umbellata]|nr:hypothetical protein BY458DRAFT_162692 [Sporodiniella umbellata]